MLDQPAPHLGAVFDAAAALQGQTDDAQFLGQTAARAIGIAFAPTRMGAAGIRPKPRRVVFAKRAALQQNLAPTHHKNRHRLVAQPALMHLKLFHLCQRAIDPGRDHLGHVWTGETRPSRWVRFLNPILRWASGRARTSFLFI